MHAAHRGLIIPSFKPGAVKRLEPMIRRFAVEAIEAALPSGELDVVGDYAARIAIRLWLVASQLELQQASARRPRR